MRKKTQYSKKMIELISMLVLSFNIGILFVLRSCKSIETSNTDDVLDAGNLGYLDSFEIEPSYVSTDGIRICTDYPKLANMCGAGLDWIRPENHQEWLDYLAQLDLLIGGVPFTTWDEHPQKVDNALSCLRYLREKNPALKALAYVCAVELPYSSTGEIRDVYKRFLDSETGPGSNYLLWSLKKFYNSTNGQNEKWWVCAQESPVGNPLINNWFPEPCNFLYDEYRRVLPYYTTGAVDGLLFDAVWAQMADQNVYLFKDGKKTECGKAYAIADFAGTGYPVPSQEIDSLYMNHFISLRDRIEKEIRGTGFRLCFNTPNNCFKNYTLGRVFEHELRKLFEHENDEDFDDQWKSLLLNYLDWCSCRDFPQDPIVALANIIPAQDAPYTTVSDKQAGDREKLNYVKMRFGLCTALMGNGYYYYIINGLTPENQPRWFDEYRCGYLKRTGYLGKPLTKAGERKQGIWARLFEHGLVLVNPTKNAVKFSLGNTYWHIYGEMPRNNGMPCNAVEIPPHDGYILINWDPLRCAID